MRKIGVLTSALLGIALAQLPGTASALNKWTFSTGSCASGVAYSQGNLPGGTGTGTCGAGTGEWSDSRVYGADGNSSPPSVTVTGWGATIESDTTLEQGAVTHFGTTNGLGVANRDGGTDRDQDTGEFTAAGNNHAVDNVNRLDFVLFDWGSAGAQITQVELGFFDMDSDLSVLALTDPDVDLFGGASADDLDQQEVTRYVSSGNVGTETLTSNGWDVVANIDVDSVDNTSPYTVDISSYSTDISTRYWLIGAYTEAFGDCDVGTCQSAAKDSKYADKFKIISVTADLGSPPSTGIPEPGTLLLLASGGLPWMIVRRRRSRR